MKGVTVIVALFAAGIAYAASVSVGGFYAPSIPVGGELFKDPDYPEFDAETSIFGFGWKFAVGDVSGLNFDYGFSYNPKYGVYEEFGAEGWWSAIRITSGVSYKFDGGPVKPYFGIGGAYVIMGVHERIPSYADYDDRFCYPGAYLGGGIIYPFTNIIALDVNPRYMTAINPDDGGMDFQFFDILLGVDFYL